MNIAMMVRGYLTAPQPKDIIYAPVDLAIGLCKGLAKRGHTVDFYGPLGSEIGDGVNIRTNNLRPLVSSQSEIQDLFSNVAKMSHYVPELWDSYLADTMFKKAARGDYDLLHFHHPEVALSRARMSTDTPVVHTLHDPIFPWYKELFELFDTPNQHYISISDNQRRDAPDLRYAATVHNGINIEYFPYNSEPEDYLLIAGRIVPEKGFKEAVQLAKQTGDRLLIIGPVYPDTQGYFDQYIKPHLSDKILYLGFIEQTQMWRYYQKAKAFLTPVQWEEPFGLTTIEAMACGTPVVSLRRGAASEIIQDGKTGFLVDSMAEMAAALEKITDIKRENCRDYVKDKFSMDRMVDAYEAAFEQVIRKKTGKSLFGRNFTHPKIKKIQKKIKSSLANQNQLHLPIHLPLITEMEPPKAKPDEETLSA